MTSDQKRLNLRHTLKSAFWGFALSFLTANSVFAAAPICSQIYAEKAKPAIRLLESSVEIETSPELIDPFMTTTDGSIRPITGSAGIKALPENILKDITESFPELDPLDVAWDVLTSKEKQEIIMQSALVRGQDFYQTRTIPGLIYRQQIKITLPKAARLMGKDYPAGTHTFNSKEIFGTTAIEFMGPNRMTEKLGIEIHLRSSLGADENYISSRTLQSAMTARINNVHQHVVARLPIKKMSQDPEGMAFVLTEFIRREMIRAQFVKLRDAQPIERIENELAGDNMPVTKRIDFQNVFTHFLELGQSLKSNVDEITTIRSRNDRRENSFLNKALQTALAQKIGLKPLKMQKINPDIRGNPYARKMGLIGVRSFEFYDGSRWQWGIEYRDLSPHRQLSEQIARLKKAQERMISQNYAIDFVNLNSWLQSKNLSQKAGELYFPDQASFTGAMVDLAANFPHIKALQDPTIAQAVKAACRKQSHNTGLNVLFHDWSQDPIVNGNRALIAQIEDVQNIAIQRLARGEKSETVLQYFIKKSSLDYQLQQL